MEHNSAASGSQDQATKRDLAQLCNHCRAGIFNEEFDNISIETREHGLWSTKDYWPHHETIRELEKCGQTCALCEKLFQQITRKANSHSIKDFYGTKYAPIMFPKKSFPEKGFWTKELDWELDQSVKGRINILGYIEDDGDDKDDEDDEDIEDIEDDGNSENYAGFYDTSDDEENESEEESWTQRLNNPIMERNVRKVRGRSIWNTEGATLEDRWELIAEWCNNCTRNHPECSYVERRRLPARLLNIPLQDSANPILVDTDTMDATSIQYTSLSHCWGHPSKKPIRTLLSNLSSFKSHGIPFDEIPRTFRDAMAITRKLGIRYIWIDSLCIIQDCTSDWQAEAAKMCDVYECSYLNIAAVNSPDGDGGCSLQTSISLKAETPEGKITRFLVPRSDRAEVDSAVLLERGWVSQELALSPRVLYCSSQFYFECQGSQYAEDGSISENGVLSKPFGKLSKWRKSDSFDLDALNKWRNWVSHYCGLKFTYPQDSMPAMVGIVKWYERTYSTSSLLGCWSEDLANELAWKDIAVEGEESAELDSGISAQFPSWSWVRIPLRRISYSPSTRFQISCISLERAFVNWSAAELTSNVLSSQLVVKGFVFRFEVKQDSWYEEDNQRVLYIRNTTEFFNPGPWDCNGYFEQRSLQQMKAGADGKVWASGILLFFHSYRPKSALSLKFLLLKEDSSADVEGGKHRRIGIANMTLVEEAPGIRRKLIETVDNLKTETLVPQLEDLFKKKIEVVELV